MKSFGYFMRPGKNYQPLFLLTRKIQRILWLIERFSHNFVQRKNSAGPNNHLGGEGTPAFFRARKVHFALSRAQKFVNISGFRLSEMTN
jgi:hypothetical protein